MDLGKLKQVNGGDAPSRRKMKSSSAKTREKGRVIMVAHPGETKKN